MTARPCVTAPAGDEAVQNEAVRATRLSEYEMAVPGRRGPVLSIALGPGVQRSAHVIRYVAGLSLPATAWPRQTLLAVHHGHSGPPGPALHGHSGGCGWAGSSSAPDPGEWWWCRLGRRIPTYLLGVRGREPPDEEITKQVISQ